MTGEGAAVGEKRKLIEVALPLEAINKESAREKSIRHGHPSTLHLWWARRPLAAARAVLFAQLVDDPDSTAEAEAIADPDERSAYVVAERARLFRLIEELVLWENSTNEDVLERARAEIRRSTGGNPPPILDPFAGGGSIPLEAQRLGLEAHASDLNPVAVLINKALIEIPPLFAGRPPVHPDAATGLVKEWSRATGLAEDVRRYGAWMRDEAEKRIGHLYPKAVLDDGTTADVIAWIWARTVTCPNPACGIDAPLVRSWWLGKKKGKEAFVIPHVVDGRVEFDIGHDPKEAPEVDGTMSGRRGGVCIACGTAIPMAHVKAQGADSGLGATLMAVVGAGKRARHYVAPTLQHIAAATNVPDVEGPTQELPYDPRNIWTPPYGLTRYAHLFTNRQLVALTTFSDLVGEAREKVLADALAAGMPAGACLADGGSDAEAYADAVATYLGFALSRSTNKNSTICSWDSSTKMEAVRSVFARQALPMSWDFAEANPFASSSGSFIEDVGWVTSALDRTPATCKGTAAQADAGNLTPLALISTDPPYYDNIGYSDLSDYFYVWLRRSLRSIHPDLLATMLVPKAEELVANPYRHGGKDGAKQFFEDGFNDVFRRARDHATDDYPISVYYAFKQSESDIGGTASTGWETLLEGMVRGSWRITGTWPMRSELGNRMLAMGTNALASSIVLALRPRAEDAPRIDRRAFMAELKATLPEKLRELQQGSIAPVDLPQAAIGPGMAVYSAYSRVLESDGSSMTVRTALKLINEVLAEVLYEQEGDLDAGTRWCVKWFSEYGFEDGDYGAAEGMASAYNIAVAALDRCGAVRARAGKVRLLSVAELDPDYDPRKDDHIILWEVVLHLAKALDETGLDAAGALLAHARTRIDLEPAKELAYLLFSIAQDKKWSAVAQLFNQLAASWPDVVEAARHADDADPEQLGFVY